MKLPTFPCAILFSMAFALTGYPIDQVGRNEPIERLAPMVDFTLQKGTNRPVSSATAKALGLGEDKIPATQVGFLPKGETLIRVFGVSAKNTNDLFIALIDNETHTATVWLTTRTSEIRATVLTSTNGPPQIVSNES